MNDKIQGETTAPLISGIPILPSSGESTPASIGVHCTNIAHLAAFYNGLRPLIFGEKPYP